MPRVLAAVATIGATAALAGCVGDTQQASLVMSTRAQLNARGHTNNGPAYWWWEYGFTRKGVGDGKGTKTARNGPSSSANDVNLNVVLKGLDPAQSYYFRACGQDQKAGSAVTCGRVLDFRTALGDSELDRVGGGVVYRADPNAPHDVLMTGTAHPGDGYEDLAFRERGIPDGTVKDASDIATNAPSACSVSNADSFGFNNLVTCGLALPESALLDFGNYDDYIDAQGAPEGAITANLGGGNDQYFGAAGPNTVHAGAGNDGVHGGGGKDTLYGDDGDDTFYGGDGDDVIYGGAGTNSYDCGPGYDVLHVTNYAEWGYRSTHCESYVIESAPAQARSAGAGAARAGASMRTRPRGSRP